MFLGGSYRHRARSLPRRGLGYADRRHDLLPAITTPTQIVAGRHDDLVPWSNNEYLGDLLPNSEIHPLDAGHFAWEQAAEEYGRLVVDWVSGGYRRVLAD